MRTVPLAERITADEYLARDWIQDAELIAGEIVVNSPSWDHQLISARIYLPLADWMRAAGDRGFAIWDLDVKLGDHDVYRPDILWYRHGRVPQRGDRRPFPVPELAVETRSPSTWRFDVGRKKTIYEERGLPELWLADTEGDVILAFRRSSPTAAAFDVELEIAVGDTLTSPQLPGFALPVGDVFVEAR